MAPGRYAPPAMSREAAPEPSFLPAYAAWFVALCAMLGSVFLGEVMGLPACTLCWYQRICLFPLTVVLAVGIVLRDGRLTTYAMPLVMIGMGIAVYHNLLSWGVVSEALAPCTGDVSCSEQPIEWFGFITIPLLSFGAFATILIALVWQQITFQRTSA